MNIPEEKKTELFTLTVFQQLFDSFGIQQCQPLIASGLSLSPLHSCSSKLERCVDGKQIQDKCYGDEREESFDPAEKPWLHLKDLAQYLLSACPLSTDFAMNGLCGWKDEQGRSRHRWKRRKNRWWCCLLKLFPHQIKLLLKVTVKTQKALGLTLTFCMYL